MSLHLHFDLVGGMAGDMTLAALLDLGADATALQAALADSGLPLTTLTAEHTWRGGLAGHAVSVAPEVDPPARTWLEIRDLIGASRLSTRARERATAIFERLAVAEAATHGCTPDEVHFHEVGAMDAIVDIVATAVLLDQLDATSFSCGPVPVCEGEVACAHGVLPLPAPATARLLTGFTLLPVPGGIETITPTGAAILSTLCPEGDGTRPSLRLIGTGTGLGNATLPDRPNVLRVLSGSVVGADAPAPGAVTGDATVLEANIDDMDPRLFGHLAEALFHAGALDVSLLPVQMKKGRPGTLLQVQCRDELAELLTERILRETTTLGVRRHAVQRTELARRHRPVETPWGQVRIKEGLLGDEVVNSAPEYEDCLALARRHGVPLKDVLAAAIAAHGLSPRS